MRKWLFWALVGLPVLLWGSLQIYRTMWWVENIVAFPALFFVYYLVVAVGFLLCRYWLHSATAGIIAVVFYAMTLPESILSTHHCRMPVSIIQFNLRYENPNPNAFINYLLNHPADLVVMQEVAPEQGEKFKLLSDIYPYYYGGQEGVGYPSSQMVLSKRPLHAMSVYMTPDQQQIISGTWHLSAGRKITLLTAHPPSPRNKALWYRRNALISTIERIVEQYPSPEMLIIGDFNLSATSLRYSSLFPEFDSKPVATWPNWSSWFTTPAMSMIGIDHLWLKSQRTDWNICSRTTQGSVEGSDHKMVRTTIGY